MYMALIGMAIVAVPRSVFRALVWLVMGVVGWLLAGVESAYAAVTWSFNSTTGKLTITGDANANHIAVESWYPQPGFAYEASVVLDGNRSLVGYASAVLDIEITGGGGDDTIVLDSINSSFGFSGQPDASVVGGDGSDWILGGDWNDTLVGGPGKDTMFGALGADSLVGGAGDDDIWHATQTISTGPDGSVDTIDTDNDDWPPPVYSVDDGDVLQ